MTGPKFPTSDYFMFFALTLLFGQSPINVSGHIALMNDLTLIFGGCTDLRKAQIEIPYLPQHHPIWQRNAGS